MYLNGFVFSSSFTHEPCTALFSTPRYAVGTADAQVFHAVRFYHRKHIVLVELFTETLSIPTTFARLRRVV